MIPPAPRSQTWLLAVASSDTDNACRQSSTAGSAACKKYAVARRRLRPAEFLTAVSKVGKTGIRSPADLSQSREIRPRIGAQIMCDQRLPQHHQPQFRPGARQIIDTPLSVPTYSLSELTLYTGSRGGPGYYGAGAKGDRAEDLCRSRVLQCHELIEHLLLRFQLPPLLPYWQAAGSRRFRQSQSSPWVGLCRRDRAGCAVIAQIGAVAVDPASACSKRHLAGWWQWRAFRRNGHIQMAVQQGDPQKRRPRADGYAAEHLWKELAVRVVELQS